VLAGGNLTSFSFIRPTSNSYTKMTLTHAVYGDFIHVVSLRSRNALLRLPIMEKSQRRTDNCTAGNAEKDNDGDGARSESAGSDSGGQRSCLSVSRLPF